MGEGGSEARGMWDEDRESCAGDEKEVIIISFDAYKQKSISIQPVMPNAERQERYSPSAKTISRAPRLMAGAARYAPLVRSSAALLHRSIRISVYPRSRSNG